MLRIGWAKGGDKERSAAKRKKRKRGTITYVTAGGELLPPCLEHVA